MSQPLDLPDTIDLALPGSVEMPGASEVSVSQEEEKEIDDPSEHSENAPFVVEHLRLQETPGGYFTPSSRLLVTAALRTSGLLRILSEEGTRTLLAVLTFLTANGRIQPTISQVAEALGVGEAKAWERLNYLCAVSWQGRPLAHLLRREQGQDVVTMSRAVLQSRDAPRPPSGSESLPSVSPPSSLAASREAVISHSRTTYARPRAEVEREILAQLGHAPGEFADTPEGTARRRLSALGVPREQSDLLFAHHTIEEIADQLDWLPLRNANYPARYIVAAIQGRYEPPARIRLDRALAKEESETRESSSVTTFAVEPDEKTLHNQEAGND
jgi:hypothetical protein